MSSFLIVFLNSNGIHARLRHNFESQNTFSKKNSLTRSTTELEVSQACSMPVILTAHPGAYVQFSKIVLTKVVVKMIGQLTMFASSNQKSD